MLSFLLALAHQSQAADTVELKIQGAPYGGGVGIVFGDPSGISVAYRPNEDYAIQGTLGWSFRTDHVHVAGDYLYTLAMLRIPELDSVEFSAYAGLGGMFAADEKYGAYAGARVPVGIAMLPRSVPVDVFFEVVPSMWLIPSTTPRMYAGLGVRGYFFD